MLSYIYICVFNIPPKMLPRPDLAVFGSSIPATNKGPEELINGFNENLTET